jgi:hypothetical protein
MTMRANIKTEDFLQLSLLIHRERNWHALKSDLFLTKHVYEEENLPD